MTIKEENVVLVKPVNKYNIKKMQSRFSFILSVLACLFCLSTNGYAQEITAEENNNPVILYSATPKKYEIGGIKVEGVKNYEDYVLIVDRQHLGNIGLSGNTDHKKPPVIQIAVCRAARAASQFVPKGCTKSEMISRYDKLCFESGGYVGSLPDYQSRICLPGHPGKLQFEDFSCHSFYVSSVASSRLTFCIWQSKMLVTMEKRRIYHGIW